MTLFDIIGPVMVGPSSSHTAGAVKIGLAARKLMRQKILSARIDFHGSFLATGHGHGTDCAVVAGLLGMAVDDERMPDSIQYAEDAGMRITFGACDLGEDAHPNSVRMFLTGDRGKTLEIEAASLGGGRIMITKLDGLSANFSGDFPTLIVHNQDTPGHVAEVTMMLKNNAINIATMQLYRASRGGSAVMVLECDQEIPIDQVRYISGLPGINKVTYYSLEES
ncbi:MAG: L-serine ammonia-lyase, iron-sulfur-dependent subunit beta [Oribacterium sp.]|nr:L-serine ammonia-lyase, iron-sulfur-dependent subunit beta [Oribacterium sp.]